MSSNVKVTLIFMVGVFIAAIGYGQTQTFECPGTSEIRVGAIVREGDTIDGIIRNNCTGNARNAVDAVVMERGSALIHPGDVVYFP